MGLPAIAAAAIPAVIAGVSAMITNHQSNKASRDNMRLQYELNEQMTDKMLQYNSPASQMQRFKDAGLNPDLIYGQSSTGESQMAVTDAPGARFENPAAAALSAANQSRLTQSQIDLNESQAARNYSAAGESDSHARNLDRLTESQEIVDLVGRANAQKLSAESDRIKGLTLNDEVQRSILSHEDAIKAMEEEHYEDKLKAEIDRMIADIGLKGKQAEAFAAQAYAIYAKTPAEIAELYARADKEDALQNYYDSQSATLYKAIWENLPFAKGLYSYESSVTGRRHYNFQNGAAAAAAYTDQALDKGLKHAGKIVGMATDIATAGKAKAVTKQLGQVRETQTRTTGPGGTTTTNTWSRHRDSYN